jgi:hypothetical protein
MSWRSTSAAVAGFLDDKLCRPRCVRKRVSRPARARSLSCYSSSTITWVFKSGRWITMLNYTLENSHKYSIKLIEKDKRCTYTFTPLLTCYFLKPKHGNKFTYKIFILYCTWSMSWTQYLLDLIACKIECNHFTQKLKLMEKNCSMF